MPQLSYNLDHTAAAPGQLVDKQSPVMRELLIVETAAGIAAGLAVSYGTAANQAVIGGTAFAGVSMRSSRPGDATTNAEENEQYEPIEVMTHGKVYVTVSGSVAHTDSVAYINASGLFTAGPAGAGETDVTNAKFRGAATDGNVVALLLGSSATVAGS